VLCCVALLCCPLTSDVLYLLYCSVLKRTFPTLQIAGPSVPESDLGKMAAAEEELKGLVKVMSIRGRKWADSKDALEQAANQQGKGEELQRALDSLVDHLDKMREHVDLWSDAVYDAASDAEDDEEKAACEAKEAAAAMAECVARMYRFKVTGKPTGA